MRRTLIIAATVAVAAAGAAAVAGASGDDDATERAITGSALDRAKAAALANTPGKVTETEVGDEESYYEVEVTRDDGSQVDVQLDRDFNVVGGKADSENDG
ncbi:MAG TPA: PepSY domain-containing protein [Solirubrobacteraceae bacterium]|jgi:uncharacterized membrane protein YkoI|nr:PepSY domain-containing protein [Solirubrobacteraceae bacterium]